MVESCLFLREKEDRSSYLASVAELSTVKGLGIVKAEKVVGLLDAEYSAVLRREKHLTLDTS